LLGVGLNISLLGCKGPQLDHVSEIPIWIGFEKYFDQELSKRAEEIKGNEFLSPVDYRDRTEFRKGADLVRKAIDSGAPVELTVSGYGRPYEIDPEFGLPVKWGGCTPGSGEWARQEGMILALQWAAMKGVYPMNSTKSRARPQTSNS
jgi:hypothetical protein